MASTTQNSAAHKLAVWRGTCGSEWCCFLKAAQTRSSSPAKAGPAGERIAGVKSLSKSGIPFRLPSPAIATPPPTAIAVSRLHTDSHTASGCSLCWNCTRTAHSCHRR